MNEQPAPTASALPTLQIIGRVESCYQQKFGTPRQPGLVAEATAKILLCGDSARAEALQGLEAYSHLWVLFWFHLSAAQGWRPTVRPPRLGGNRRLGVFATRSPFRPNPVGLSLVEFRGWEMTGGEAVLHIAGHDLVDGTPVLDIKPYLPYADAAPEARAPAAFTDAPETRLLVRYAEPARGYLAGLAVEHAARLESLITQTLALDPRPAYRGDEQAARHGMRLAGHEVGWQVVGGTALVDRIEPAS
ncbi:MAG: tRNA (N6-threonylcarbamoyladenosine(37)-N6)-methyltransferase TrmO [Ectothiorhodospiraceae bacterium]|nr:tRNA (N6-threonylcarbamoyladenosine(37)-N6)-methyltransferase TrmO [Ectothiorhodospiraceae bacterium]MCH8503938.1 tRNA (N6-threonylcarbamoyladenosine(37)-N6)-methyltransferase TrmO [Ectothiorhodospiraceae bacterium]